MFRQISIVFACLFSTASFAAEPAVSIKIGERIAFIGGCHDCHTPGYAQAGGVLDPAKALIGNPVGYDGPWGTTFAVNLRIVASEHSEKEWVGFLKSVRARPPMPWFNLKYLTDDESRSLYMYIKSLGAVGKPAPDYIPPKG